jgi:MFS family permease
MSQSKHQTGPNDAGITAELHAQVAPANDTGCPKQERRVGLLGLPRTYWVLWSGMLLNRLGGSVFFLLALYLTRERGLRPEVAGLVIGLYAAGGMFAGPLGGVLADRAGRRATLLAGTACSGTLMLALGFARATSTIVALAPFLGFFTDLCRPALQAAVTDVVTPGTRTRAFGLLYWAINLGFAGAAAFGGILADHNFGLLFVINALTTFAFGAIVLVGVPETRPALPPERPRARGHQALIAPFRDGPFITFVAIQLLLLLAFAQVIVALPLDMRAHGLTTPQIGWLLGLNGVFIVIAQPIALHFVRGLSHVQWLAAGAAITGLGLGAIGLARGPLVYALATVLWTLGEIGFSTAAPALIAEFSPVEQRGAYQGAYQLAWGLASMIAPALGSLVLTRLGGPALWLGCLGACLGAAGLHLTVTARRSRASQADAGAR